RLDAVGEGEGSSRNECFALRPSFEQYSSLEVEYLRQLVTSSTISAICLYRIFTSPSEETISANFAEFVITTSKPSILSGDISASVEWVSLAPERSISSMIPERFTKSKACDDVSAYIRVPPFSFWPSRS